MIKMAKDIEELKKKEPTENRVEEKTQKEVSSTPAPAVQSSKVVELPKKEFKTAKIIIGDKAPENISAYYASNPQTIDGLIAKLKENGFEILATTEILKGKTVISVTNDELKNTNSFISVLNILVNGEDEVRVQNPSYFGAAYLQSKFKYGQFKKTLTALQTILGDMYMVKDIGEYKELEDYQFMFGMPHLDDTIELAKGNLVAKLSGDKAEKYFAYSLKLPNGNTLVGHKMRMRTNKFLNKVDAGSNALLLPYQSMIKGNEAYMLDPKFYLALSLPLLSMTDFMKIATAPDAIEKALKKAYK